MNRSTESAIWLIIIAALGLIVTFIYWAIYPYNVIEYSNLPAKVEEVVVKRGEHVHYSLDYCKYIDIGATITRSFEDGLVYSTPEFENNFGLGCSSKKIAVYVPKALPPGLYRLKNIYHFKVNPIREIEYINYTQEFVVE